MIALAKLLELVLKLAPIVGPGIEYLVAALRRIESGEPVDDVLARPLVARHVDLDAVGRQLEREALDVTLVDDAVLCRYVVQGHAADTELARRSAARSSVAPEPV